MESPLSLLRMLWDHEPGLGVGLGLGSGLSLPRFMEKAQGEKNGSAQAPRPSETIAGRLIPLIEAFDRAMKRAGGKQLGEPELSACLPTWVHNIAERLCKTILKYTLALEPKGQFNARNYGRMVGQLLRDAVFVLKDVETILRKEGLWRFVQGVIAKD